MSIDNRYLRVFIGVSVAVVALILLLVWFAPEQKVIQSPPHALSVRVLAVQAQDYEISIQSFGRVQPQVITKLIAQIGGKIIKISDNFRPGRHFVKGETLVWIESDDYRHRVTVARSQLARARSDLSMEQALSNQALRDWRRLNDKSKPPPELTARKPQLERATAEMEAMKANLAVAELNLRRTLIAAPFSGLLQRQLVDVGQVLTPGTVLAEIYANDRMEIRLPVQLRDIDFLPEQVFNGQTAAPDDQTADKTAQDGEGMPEVRLFDPERPQHQWIGRIVRAEAGLAESGYRYHLVAEVIAQVGQAFRQPVVGQYLNAIIDGKRLEQAVVIPTGALYRNEFVWLIDDQQQLQRRPVTLLWRNDEDILIADGLSNGDRVVTTRVSHALEGMPARIIP